MSTQDEVARWLYKKLIITANSPSKRHAIHHVKTTFGDDVLTINEYGKPALDPDVLKSFRRYIHGKAEWDREDLKWRKIKGAKFDEEE
jgi:hypothetical protein